jgi:hypothetical protein
LSVRQRGLGADVLRGLGEHLVERARGVADLQPQVPERVKDFIGHVLLELRQILALGGGRVEEHHVDVAEWIEFAAAVAAERDQADG